MKDDGDNGLRDAVDMWVGLAVHKFHAADDTVILSDCTVESVSEILALIKAERSKAVLDAREDQIMQDFLGIQMYLLAGEYDESVLIDWREETIDALRKQGPNHAK